MHILKSFSLSKVAVITTWPLVFIRLKAVGLLLTWEYQILRATMETAVKNLSEQMSKVNLSLATLVEQIGKT